MEKETLFRDTIKCNIFLLKLSGIISSKSEICCTIEWQNFFMILCHYCVFSFSIIYVSVLIENIAQVDLALELLSMVISMTQLIIKYTKISVSRKHFQRIMRVCEELWEDLNEQEKKLVRVYTGKVEKITVIYLLFVLSTIFFYIVGSLIVANEVIVNNANESVIIRHLPYASFVTSQLSPYFEIIFIYQVFSVSLIGMTALAIDTLGPVIILIICGHLKVIRFRLENIYHEINSNSENCNDKALSKLCNCIRYQQIILKTCREIGSLMEFIFLIQLLGSTYNISLMGFKLVGPDPDNFKFATQGAVAAMQLYLCNWPPDVLLHNSATIANSAYSTPWISCSAQFRSTIHIMIMKFQQPIRLTAGNFVTLSLETFAAMMSRAVSFFTVLNSVR